MIDLPLVLSLAVLGTATGFLAGLLGMGGAMLMVPTLTFLLRARGYPVDLTAKIAIATSLSTICFTSLSSLRAHHQRGAVLWPIVKLLTPGLVVGGLLGAHLAVALPARVLGMLFGAFLVFAATQMVVNRKPKASRSLPPPVGTAAVGLGIGTLASLVGAGGAFMSVPFMTWCNVKIHQAVGTSAALGFPIALAGTLGYIWAGRDLPHLPGTVGYLYLPGLAFLAVTSMLLAPLGARTAHRMDVRLLRRLFALVLYALAGYMLWK
jgi:uncharacterized protein